MPRYKESERDEAKSETRKLLLDAAIEAFASDGYAGANVNRISQSAGFAKGTIYNYFKSKRALMLALIEHISKTHIDYIAERVHQIEKSDDRLFCFFDAGFNFVSDFLPMAKVMVNNIYGSDQEFKEVMFAAYQPMFTLVGQDIIGLGVMQGVFREVEPVSTAGLVMNIYLGTASQVNEEGKTWLPAEQVADFVLHALRK